MICTYLKHTMLCQSSSSSATMSSANPTFPVVTKIKQLLAHSDSINCLVFSPDGKFLASGGEDGYIIIFKSRGWTEYKQYQTTSPIHAIVWHTCNDNVITVGSKNGI